jgi:hypothetical protein
MVVQPLQGNTRRSPKRRVVEPYEAINAPSAGRIIPRRLPLKPPENPPACILHGEKPGRVRNGSLGRWASAQSVMQRLVEGLDERVNRKHPSARPKLHLAPTHEVMGCSKGGVGNTSDRAVDDRTAERSHDDSSTELLRPKPYHSQTVACGASLSLEARGPKFEW